MYSTGINMYTNIKPRHSLKLYSYVRIPLSARTGVFFKSYQKANTNEIFQISSIDKSIFPYLYKLRDLSGEKILGSFYEEELTPVELKNTYKIQILDQKISKNNEKLYYVKYINYPDSFNEWISSKQIVE